jgi:hypothetical protein
MGKIVRTTRADVDYVLDASKRAGEQFRSGDREAARSTLRHAKAETAALGDVIDIVAQAADLDI